MAYDREFDHSGEQGTLTSAEDSYYNEALLELIQADADIAKAVFEYQTGARTTFAALVLLKALDPILEALAVQAADRVQMIRDEHEEFPGCA